MKVYRKLTAIQQEGKTFTNSQAAALENAERVLGQRFLFDLADFGEKSHESRKPFRFHVNRQSHNDLVPQSSLNYPAKGSSSTVPKEE